MHSQSWQIQFANAIRSPAHLLEHVELGAEALGYSENGIKQFPVRVPVAFADRMQRQNPNDPLLRQVFPYLDEDIEDGRFTHDPLNEAASHVAPGLLHKYEDRVLNISTGACAIHCRYCFRRHFPYQDSGFSHSDWQEKLGYIKSNNAIHEVILSGGDPLSLADSKLQEMFDQLNQINHVKRIRIHSRFPVVIPDRINKELIKTLNRGKKECIVVLHINHANEINDAMIKAIKQMTSQGMLVFNQSVLLKGINNSTETLIKLSEKLIENQIVPYYLHLLDPVSGTTHYEVGETEAKKLIKEMKNRVSGYLVPKLVREIHGQKSKISIHFR